MIDYIYGKIKEKCKDSLIIEINGIGYNVFTYNMELYKIDDEIKLYIYTQMSESEINLYGFKTKDDRSLFVKLLKVRGLGPKVGIGFYKYYDLIDIVSMINDEDIKSLTRIPHVGEKLAIEVVKTLKNKVNIKGIYKRDDELILVLEKLGYDTLSINKVIGKIDSSKNIDDKIKLALELLNKED